MIDPILRQTEALLRQDIRAAEHMRWLFRLSPWNAGRETPAPRYRAAR
ncbi:hypothetical protein ROJ8625_02685 [Roseivivax jejudonensis]|uniref:Uncharacterized protein n=1 Tax=Roseivivax jejudonensis TaxID=1529041 RepID=A0A1X6ZIS9_9RHOB|nr:hypothetical protein [Roseivivax jejudonensis]SLN52871.1 hypothetical protein ROJ8625_02685 [Roseivivax jejudonensis]